MLHAVRGVAHESFAADNAKEAADAQDELVKYREKRADEATGLKKMYKNWKLNRARTKQTQLRGLANSSDSLRSEKATGKLKQALDMHNGMKAEFKVAK